MQAQPSSSVTITHTEFFPRDSHTKHWHVVVFVSVRTSYAPRGSEGWILLRPNGRKLEVGDYDEWKYVEPHKEFTARLDVALPRIIEAGMNEARKRRVTLGRPPKQEQTSVRILGVDFFPGAPHKRAKTWHLSVNVAVKTAYAPRGSRGWIHVYPKGRGFTLGDFDELRYASPHNSWMNLLFTAKPQILAAAREELARRGIGRTSPKQNADRGQGKRRSQVQLRASAHAARPTGHARSEHVL